MKLIFVLYIYGFWWFLVTKKSTYYFINKNNEGKNENYASIS